MAKIDIRDNISYDLTRVYASFRDHLKELAQYLPTISEIIVEKHERTDDDTIKAVNIWKAAGEEIPKIVSPFISADKMQWIDRATWHDGETYCDWEMEVAFFPEAISCKGQTRYTKSGDITQVHISGELKVDAKKIPGVPRLLAGKIGDAVEVFVVKMITPNLKEVNRGVEKYLAAQDKA